MFTQKHFMFTQKHTHIIYVVFVFQNLKVISLLDLDDEIYTQ